MLCECCGNHTASSRAMVRTTSSSPLAPRSAPSRMMVSTTLCCVLWQLPEAKRVAAIQ